MHTETLYNKELRISIFFSFQARYRGRYAASVGLVWAVCDTYSTVWTVQVSFSPRGGVNFDTYSVILAVQVSFSLRGAVSFDTYSVILAVQVSFSLRGRVSFDTYSMVLAVQVSFSSRGGVNCDTYCGVCGKLVSKKAAIGYPMTAGAADQPAVRSEPVTLFIISFSVSS